MTMKSRTTKGRTNKYRGICEVCNESHVVRKYKGLVICYFCSSPKDIIGHLDTLFSRFIRMRDGKVEIEKMNVPVHL